MFKKGLVILFCLMFVTSMVFAGGGGQQQQPAGGGAAQAPAPKKVELKVGMTLTLESHYGMGLQELKKLLDTYSKGTISLEIFPNSQLGSERELIEGCSLGTIPMALTATGPIPNFFPEFACLDLPYLFPTAAIAYKALDGEVGQALLAQMPSKGIIGLGFWENGFRHVTNSKREIKTPADLRGLKIRTMENNIHMDTYKLYGASPTPMAMGEVFIALQQGTVDGQENPAVNILTSKLNEVQKYMSLTGNFYSPSVLMISKKVFDSMSKEQQEAFMKAANEAKAWQRKFSQDNDANMIARIKASGTIVTEVNLQEWIDFSQPIYKAYEGKLNQDFIRKIKAIK